MIRRLALGTSLMVALAPPAAAQFEAARIDSLVEARRILHGVSGIAIAIVHPMAVLHEGGFGTARDGTTPITPLTTFTIPAYSGPITGTLAFRLIDRGVLSLDTPVHASLSAFALADSAASRQITPLQLLLHRSGIPAGPSPVGAPPPARLDDAVTALRGARPASAPGTDYSYAEANYHVLARLLEVVSGAEYPTLVQSEIRTPLLLAPPATVAAPGTLHFSASELGRFIRAHLNLGALGDTTLLSTTSVVEMTSFDSGARHAAGWGWRTIPGRNAIGYSAVLEASQVEIVMLTSDGIGLVLLANGMRADQRRGMQQLAEDVARMSVGEEPSPSLRSSRGTLLVALSAAVAITAAIVAARRRRQVA
jgi:CubicO group peptidase (beta-lactamase class C family)